MIGRSKILLHGIKSQLDRVRRKIRIPREIAREIIWAKTYNPSDFGIKKGNIWV